ncbi:ribosomal protein HS6-type (S12/L30/L7a) [Desulfosporosinus orientis DSM 765]|uniref:Ribosomal protein HS6-type (S12/L30/L7a) n=1 Tax=Desulfosporosinus orientis (strain ATCC 19365 / DSM 765 / NCIMB 8382 / VKM B-1628 / Singapore I) TaxID=768706 RepID=G7WC55_DESOD|nr:ribosomal L7Ae/L30e/S12e/Gadd45 family protein [Desulfosporosinus orientis]AET70029.1 ribosomal protein HS6-type (S12/L30/L7a) [Desulfosporosinus orientis DSM 765]
MNTRIQSLIGIARRAGRIASGDAQIEAMVKKRKGFLLIIAEDAHGAQKKYSQWASDISLPVLIAGTKLELGRSIGLSPRSAVLILDQGFAKAILLARS